MDQDILQDLRERAKYLSTLTEIGVDRAAFAKTVVVAPAHAAASVVEAPSAADAAAVSPEW